MEAPGQVWATRLIALVDALLLQRFDTAWHTAAVKRTISEQLGAADGGWSADLNLPAVTAILEDAFDRVGGNPRFVAGGVTFCNLVPMRSIPFRVVALLGMDDDVFPRRPHALSFDRLPADPRIGDRTSSDDDRYQILESILAARDRLIVTWSGHDPADNKPRPASVPIAELLDTAAAACRGAKESLDEARSRLVTLVPLQAFDERIFEAGASYDRRMLAAAHALRGMIAAPEAGLDPRVEPFVRSPLPDLEGDDRISAVTLSELVRFFDSPARQWLQRRLGVRFESSPDSVPSEDPLKLKSGLPKWGAMQTIISDTLAGVSAAETDEAIWRRQVLPTGVAGRLELEGPNKQALEISAAAQNYMDGEARDFVLNERLTVCGHELVLTGRLTGIHTQGRVIAQASKMDEKRLFRAWVEHVALAALDPEYDSPTIVFGVRPRSHAPLGYRLDPFGDGTPKLRMRVARGLLTQLLEVFILGHSHPVALEPEAARMWAARPQDDAEESAQDAARAARKEWVESYDGLLDRHVERIFGTHGPHELTASGVCPPAALRFDAVADRLVGPMLEHLVPDPHVPEEESA